MSKLKFFITILFISALFFVGSGQQVEVNAFSSQVIQRGATGEDVIELQSRLKYIGFYTSKVDGVFGYNTYWAVRIFQDEFGLPVDGVVGPKTKEKLVKATVYDKGDSTGGGSSNVPNGFSQNDIQLMANAVYGESRGESYTGQVAVAAVILNRVRSASFPNTVAGVIYEPGAFTAVADGQINLTPNETAKKAVLDAVNGWDPSDGAIYYFNPDTATSSWIWSRPQIKQIGKHIFCK
ncbi:MULTISPECIES: spore cortex-lytic enzyme [Bacillaceae]|uniref:spore cortex-lytic enzyme n=1 Tax=Bacillaceae TaxID=186817 RepID=UPI001C56C977|nr:spore cortex-lytic enzyme [Rossellomorea sp. YZS02]MBW3110967.1 spore cortex-lytic enzyme [Bacillus sp. MCCB 382]MDX8344285.1 spore cortex-lytic enzyme [Rossellomorea sp. YZS02]